VSAPGTSWPPVVVGILYPSAWYGDPTGFADRVAELCALDPRVEVVVESFVDLPARRVGRRSDGESDGADVLPPAEPLTDTQRTALGRIEVALTLDLPDDLGAIAPALRWVQAIGAGVDHLEPKVASTPVRLTTNGGSNAIGIAEFVMARILEHYKPLAEIAELQREHTWAPRYGRQLAGTTVALLGFGPINQAVAARAIAFGMRVLVVRRTPGDPPPGVADVVGADGLLSTLSAADVVIAAMPETPETTGMIGSAELASMRPGAFFCNVGRGSLVDEIALIEALESGHLGGAAIDVASAEPLPADNPLWDAPRLHISAHCSSVPSAMFPEVHRLFRENLARYLAGQPLASEVDVRRV
jgi:phosphoglycerate dehydrogenase-like enzyme